MRQGRRANNSPASPLARQLLIVLQSTYMLFLFWIDADNTRTLYISHSNYDDLLLILPNIYSATCFLCERRPFIGSVSRDFFLLVFFHESVYHQPRGPFGIFTKIHGDIHKSRCTTSINNTGGKFATGVRDTGGK